MTSDPVETAPVNIIAQVALDGSLFSFDQLYSYRLPTGAAPRPGCRVLVPFGQGNITRIGMIFSLESGPAEGLKTVLRLLEEEPVLNEEMLRLAIWLKERTFCTYFDAVRLMLPAGINLRLKATYHIAESVTPATLSPLTGEEAAVAAFLLEHRRSPVEREKLLKTLGLSGDSDAPEALCKKGILYRADEAVRRMGDATVRMVRLTEAGRDYTGKLTKGQKAVLELLRQVETASVKELSYFLGITQSVALNLAKKGLTELYQLEVYRTPQAEAKADPVQITLTQEQQTAYDTLLADYRSGAGKTALLYGVTGAGKTQVFLKLADTVVAEGKGVIVMVPEISLTPQALGIFRRRYGNRVAVFHSAMSLGQRMDEWKRVKKGEAVVAIGTRSAIFAPFEQLGLIIMDEEQESTYKSEQSPRFMTKDVARFRAVHHGGLLLLASATPSLETFAAAKVGRYTLCTLRNRYGRAVLPTVHTVDMQSQMMGGNPSPFSEFLLESLRQSLECKEQAILLLNRRGHNTYVSCRSCGHVMTCPNCSISMTYHSANKRLMCHYCGFSQPYTDTCPACGQQHIRYAGIGTQRAEEELAARFPDARILRMDADTIMVRTAYAEKFEAFGRGEYDILLGTQMVAKGLDFPRVTLVGVLNADASLYSDDYRATERTFSLLTQVVGRSGRGDSPGLAIVQTTQPENTVIELARRQDYDAFFAGELAARKLMIYPPYCDICQLGILAPKGSDAKAGSEALLAGIHALCEGDFSDVKIMALGPAPASVPLVAGRYRYRLLLKCKNNARFREMLRTALLEFSGHAGHGVTAFADMNPYNIL